MGKKRRSKGSAVAVENQGELVPTGASMVQNEGIGGGINFNGPGSAVTETVSTVNPMLINLRWYLVSNYRQFLNQLYAEIGLVQTITDVPVDDALRGGVEIKSHQLDERQLEELTNSLDRDDDLQTVGFAAKWNRLFGGSGIIIFTDQDPEDPLDISAIGPDTPLEFRAVDMWELFSDKQSTEGFDPGVYEEPVDYYDYYGENVHKSRVLRMTGQTAPSFIRPRLRGWGMSVVEALVRSINQYLRATDVAFEVLDEFKLDIYKIKNLVNTLLSPTGAQTIHNRVAQANRMKNYQNAIVMDSEDDYVQKQLSFAGFADAMAQIRMQVAADMRMPLTKLFGLSAAGFNSGEDDIEVYNAMVEAQVRNKIKYHILNICEIKCQKMFGYVPDDLSLTFKPLRVMSSEQEETVKTQKFTRLQQAVTAGLITPEEFRDACNRGNLFDVKLDTTQDLIGGFEDDTIGDDDEEGGASEDPTDGDSTGANQIPTRKAGVTKNSSQFDKASYDADGGDGWISDSRKYFYENPKDRGLWETVKAESLELYSTFNWKFAVWLYQKRGGGF